MSQPDFVKYTAHKTFSNIKQTNYPGKANNHKISGVIHRIIIQGRKLEIFRQNGKSIGSYPKSIYV